MNSRPLRIFALAFGLALAALPSLAVDQRTIRESFEIGRGDRLRIHNLAGKIRLEEGRGSAVEVEATVFAEGSSSGETRQLLDNMRWIEGRDRRGNAIRALSYPVDDYRGFHFPGADPDDDAPGFLERLIERFNFGETSSYYLGERVTVYGRQSHSVPTLYAEITVRVPGSGELAVRNVVGPITGGSLSGDLEVDTGSGTVEIQGFDGILSVDTGSGHVELGSVRGEIAADTGSGHIEVEELIGNGEFDTGSGHVVVANVQAGRLEADTGSGSITIENGSVGALVADTGSGSIKVHEVDVETFEGDTGSGGVTLISSLSNARDVVIDTGSGSVKIVGGADASFDISASIGAGRLSVEYDDAVLRKRGHQVVGATRGDGRTRIRVGTGSGSCTIRPSDD